MHILPDIDVISCHRNIYDTFEVHSSPANRGPISQRFGPSTAPQYFEIPKRS
jgi:hypothetical protein